ISYVLIILQKMLVIFFVLFKGWPSSVFWLKGYKAYATLESSNEFGSKELRSEKFCRYEFSLVENLPQPLDHSIFNQSRPNCKRHASFNIDCFQLTATKEGMGNSNDRPQPPVFISSVKYFPALTTIDIDMALIVVISGTVDVSNHLTIDKIESLERESGL
ncbi:hypothetical protein Tco_1502833, partial [Tanacetum coccineum]